MTKIIRTKTKAHGGITAAEKAAMADHAKKWIAVAMQTGKGDRQAIYESIAGIYAAAKLKTPRIVIVSSPLVMAFAYGASAAIWHARKTGNSAATEAAIDAATNTAIDAAIDAATYAATDAATREATDVATYTATRAVTNIATDAATDAATYIATDAATREAIDASTISNEKQAAQACYELAGNLGIECAKRWYNSYQGGNMWATWISYLSATRDILGLDLPEHSDFATYERAAMHSGFRVMHEEFCIVSDFPDILKVDAENRPHCENGPSHRWSDGWSLYHWHGVKVPAEWIEDKAGLTAKTALTWKNIEQRRAACEILGWAKILKELKARVIDKDDDPQIGTLLEVDLPGSGKERFIHVMCGTGREFALPVPPTTKTALEGNAWTYGLDADMSFIPEVRT